MTPEQKIKHLILLLNWKWAEVEPALVRDDNIDELYDTEDCTSDAECEIRQSGICTYLDCDDSRHYESESVAAQMPDGTWVGWTYWFGGGKHGEPNAIDWMEHAYDLDVVSEEKLVTVHTFTKRK